MKLSLLRHPVHLSIEHQGIALALTNRINHHNWCFLRTIRGCVCIRGGPNIELDTPVTCWREREVKSQHFQKGKRWS